MEALFGIFLGLARNLIMVLSDWLQTESVALEFHSTTGISPTIEFPETLSLLAAVCHIMIQCDLIRFNSSVQIDFFSSTSFLSVCVYF